MTTKPLSDFRTVSVKSTSIESIHIYSRKVFEIRGQANFITIQHKNFGIIAGAHSFFNNL
jgi:hypothetical protein